MTDRVRRRVVVRGRVQGVGFRESTREAAERFGVDGWVRNLPDGAVEAVIEGAPPAVDRVVDFCRVGPPAATVTTIDVREEPAGDESGFTVRPTPYA